MTSAQLWRYRTSAALLRRYLRGERMSQDFVRLAAANVIAGGRIDKRSRWQSAN